MLVMVCGDMMSVLHNLKLIKKHGQNIDIIYQFLLHIYWKRLDETWRPRILSNISIGFTILYDNQTNRYHYIQIAYESFQ